MELLRGFEVSGPRHFVTGPATADFSKDGVAF